MGKSKKSEHIFRTSFGHALGLSKKDRRQSAAPQGSRRCFKPLISFRIGLAVLSAGSMLGLNVEAAQPPLWTLLRGWTSERVRFTQRGYVGTFNVAFCLGSRLLFAAWRQTGRLAVACISIPPGRERHSCVLAVSVRSSAFVGSLRVWPFLYGDLDPAE